MTGATMGLKGPRATTSWTARRAVIVTMVLASLVAGMAVASTPRVALVALALAITAGAVWFLRRHFLIVMLVVLWYLPGQTAPGGLLSSVVFFRWIGLLLVPLVAAGIAIALLVSRRRFSVTPVLPFLLVLVAIVVASAAVNRSSALDTATTLLLYLRYPLLFVALFNLPVGQRSLRNFVAAFIALAGLQIPEVLFRYFVQGAYWDAISWSLGPWGHYPLGVYMVYAMCLTVGVVATRGVTLARVLFLVALLVPAVLGEIKALLLSGPLCAALIMLVPGRRLIPVRRRVTVIASVVVAAWLLFSAWATVYPGADNAAIRFVNQVASGLQSDDSAIDLGGVDRVMWTSQAAELLADRDAAILGTGPGSSLAGTATGEVSRMATGGVPGKTQLGAMLWDLGFAGLLTYYCMLLATLGMIIISLRRVTDARTRSYALALFGMWVFYALLGPNYDLVWRADSASFIFWTLLAGVWAAVRPQDRPATNPRAGKASGLSRMRRKPAPSVHPGPSGAVGGHGGSVAIAIRGECEFGSKAHSADESRQPDSSSTSIFVTPGSGISR